MSHARLGTEVRRVRWSRQAVDGDAGDALERLGDRLVGECADVGRGDRVDHGVRMRLICCDVRNAAVR